jgi:S-adenosylmethionine-diacylgycerolhomoserine-N-methlytransferase
LNAHNSEDGTSNHAQLMDKVYRHQRHIYDLTRKYYLLGRDRLVRELNAKPGESVVEIGCGTARNLIRIARAYPGAKLYGLDASAEMLITANESIARAGLKDRILLKHAYAEDMTPALFGLNDAFDHAVFSYSLSMIPDWRGALKSAAACVKPQGAIHAVDFGDLKGLWRPLANGLRAWLRLFHVKPREELLAAVERGGTNSTSRLHVLPGRYAFVFRANPDLVRMIAQGSR